MSGYHRTLRHTEPLHAPAPPLAYYPRFGDKKTGVCSGGKNGRSRSSTPKIEFFLFLFSRSDDVPVGCVEGGDGTMVQECMARRKCPMPGRCSFTSCFRVEC